MERNPKVFYEKEAGTRRGGEINTLYLANYVKDF